MSYGTTLSPIKLVNFALNNARDAGQEFDPEQIEMLWRIARGQSTTDEVDQWAKDMRTRFRNLPPDSNSCAISTDPSIADVVARLLFHLNVLQSQMTLLTQTAARSLPSCHE